ncbi:MAG: OB-fold protein [Saprospiraceae bacterium]
MKRNLILLLIFVLVLMGGMYGYYQWNRGPQDMNSAKVDLAMDASALYSEFVADEAKANEKYLDKVILVKGAVSSVDKSNGQVVIMFDTGDPMGGVLCELDSYSKHDITEFVEGEIVTLKGTCSGKISDVQISRCVLVK